MHVIFKKCNSLQYSRILLQMIAGLQVIFILFFIFPVFSNFFLSLTFMIRNKTVFYKTDDSRGRMEEELQQEETGSRNISQSSWMES